MLLFPCAFVRSFGQTVSSDVKWGSSHTASAVAACIQLCEIGETNNVTVGQCLPNSALQNPKGSVRKLWWQQNFRPSCSQKNLVIWKDTAISSFSRVLYQPLIDVQRKLFNPLKTKKVQVLRNQRSPIFERALHFERLPGFTRFSFW